MSIQFRAKKRSPEMMMMPGLRFVLGPRAQKWCPSRLGFVLVALLTRGCSVNPAVLVDETRV